MTAPWLPPLSHSAHLGALCCPRAGAAVSSGSLAEHPSRAILTLLHPPRGHGRLCSRPSHAPNGAKIHPGV